MPGVTIEAASPVLIEKVRSATSDGNGGYRIGDLRPGTYAVTFTLPGFSTFKRDAFELAGDFTATLNAQLKVGTLAETITVTGASPVVDVASAARIQTLDRETLDAERLRFVAEKQSFDGLQTAAAKRAGDEQFQQALAALEAQKPKDAYTVLRSMLDSKADAEVITYLTAMDEGKRAKILTEFIKTDDKLAASLLQQLRQHGVAAPGGSVPPGAAPQTP